MIPICEKHNCNKYRKFNSTLWVCPKCLIEHNTELLKQPHRQRPAPCKNASKEPKKGRKENWKNLPLSKMIDYVQTKIVNPYIRLRDTVNFGKCISCTGPITQAGHRYPRSTHKGMCLNIQNIHGQEISCNHFKSGNPDEYDKGLIKRHGRWYLEELQLIEHAYKSSRDKSYDRFGVLLIADTYKYLTENKIWIYRHEEFNTIKFKLLNNATNHRERRVLVDYI